MNDEINRSTMELINAVSVIFEADVARDTDATPILARALAFPTLRL